MQSIVAVAFLLQKVPPDLRAGRQAAGGRGWRGRGWLPALRAAADRGRAPVPGAVPRGARDPLRHQVRQWPGTRASRATCPGTRQSAGRRTAACARPATPPRASTASPWTAGPSIARWGTCLTYYIITCTCHISYTVHVSQECTEESTVQCYTAEECAPVAATNCVSRPREVCEQVPVQDCR